MLMAIGGSLLYVEADDADEGGRREAKAGCRAASISSTMYISDEVLGIVIDPEA